MTHDEMRALTPGQAILATLPFRKGLHAVTVARVNRETADVVDAAGRRHRVSWHCFQALGQEVA